VTARYLVIQPHAGRSVPRCELPGSPFASRKAAKAAARRAGIPDATIRTVRRSA